MSDVITIYQDYKQNILRYKEHFPVIEKFKNVLGEQNLILQTDGSIQIKNYVGFLQQGKTKVQVLPKIYYGTEFHPEETAGSLVFLFRLLQRSGYLSYKDFDELDINSIEQNVFEIFIRIFVKKFIAEYNRAPHYEYVSRIENQQIIKGKILFAETIKQNGTHIHQHIVSFDEFSLDNPLNQLFKFVIRELLIHTEDSKNKMLLRQGVTLLEEISSVPISPEFFKSIQFDRQNNRYKTLFNFARLFFFNNQPGLSSGEHHTFSFLVPLNLLFESALNIFLQNIACKLSDTFGFIYHHHRYLGMEREKSRFKLEPDFILVDNSTSQTHAVLDAKFKNPFNSNGIVDIADSDLYQLATYSSAYNCRNLIVIYPTFKNAFKTENFLTSYQLNINQGVTLLHLIQVDITKDSLQEIQDDLLLVIKNLVFVNSDMDKFGMR